MMCGFQHSINGKVYSVLVYSAKCLGVHTDEKMKSCHLPPAPAPSRLMKAAQSFAHLISVIIIIIIFKYDHLCLVINP